MKKLLDELREMESKLVYPNDRFGKGYKAGLNYAIKFINNHNPWHEVVNGEKGGGNDK